MDADLDPDPTIHFDADPTVSGSTTIQDDLSVKSNSPTCAGKCKEKLFIRILIFSVPKRVLDLGRNNIVFVNAKDIDGIIVV